MANVSKTTQDHEEIRRWAEERGARPACVKGTGGEGDIGMLRLDFPGYSGEETLQHITWEEWFDKFDERNLALLYQEETAEGERSNFNKIVSAETAQAAEPGSHRKRGSTGRTSGQAKKASSRGSASSAASRKSSGAGKKSAGKSTATSGGRKSASKTAAIKGTSSKKSAVKKSPPAAKKGAAKKAAGKKAPVKKTSARGKSRASKRTIRRGR